MRHNKKHLFLLINITLILCTSCIHTTNCKKNYTYYLHTGAHHFKQGNLDDVLYCLKQAVKTRPTNKESIHECAAILLQLGNQFFNRKEPDKAIESFKTILTMADHFSAVHHNIGFTLAEKKGKYDESIAWYRKALHYDPDNVATHFCLAFSLLATGNLTEGFQEYESRWQRGQKSPRSFTWPLEKLWDGNTDIKNKRILLRVEQGLGDTLHFIRYAQLLKKQGATVIAEIQRPLLDILALCNYIDEIIPIGSSLPVFDLQIPILNLPAIYKTTLETIPVQIPYLHADPRLVAYWHNILASDKNFKIGICWHGDLVHSASKFMPLDYFMRLVEVEGISLYSLQQATGLDQLNQRTDIDHLYQFDKKFDKHRFMDTAAVMKNLDLVITVDTSIAHLAGGLGVPVWVVLPHPAEWRWLMDRTDSPWYPTMQLFRQKTQNNWEPVIEELCNKLQTILTYAG